MNNKVKFKGPMKHFMRWPLYLSVLVVLLDLLVAHAAAEFPSVPSTLLALPQSLAAARQENSLQSLLGSCLTFLAYPALVCDHPVLAAKIARLLFLLCSHREVCMGCSPHR